MGSIIGAGEPKQELGPLDPGDAVEVGISSLYRRNGMELWIKVGTTVHVRPGEESQQAFDRGYVYCVESMNEAVMDLDRDGE